MTTCYWHTIIPAMLNLQQSLLEQDVPYNSVVYLKTVPKRQSVAIPVGMIAYPIIIIACHIASVMKMKVISYHFHHGIAQKCFIN